VPEARRRKRKIKRRNARRRRRRPKRVQPPRICRWLLATQLSIPGRRRRSGSGQLWSIDTTFLPPFTQFWRMVLQGK